MRLLIQADARRIPLADQSVHCVVTSPPYWGLRCYGTDGQIGLEKTPDEFVAELVGVFREVWRVLRDDGTLWLNLGDSYATGAGKVGDHPGGGEQGERWSGREGLRPGAGPMTQPNRMPLPGLKPKDLVGIPWLVARALQQPYYTGRIAREADRAWLAAIIDGEGTICASRHKRKDDGRVRTQAAVFVTNSCRAMLDRCGEIWPAPEYAHLKPSDGHIGERDCFRWTVQGSEEKSALLAELYPYLVSKKRQALLAWNLLEFIKDGRRLGKSPQAASVREKRDVLARSISALNQGESCDVPSWCKEPPSLYEPGWYLRSDIIWSKPNPMPESVTDRPTKAHEYLFLLTKRPRYFYDCEAVREAHKREWNPETNNPGALSNDSPIQRAGVYPDGKKHHQGGFANGPNPSGRNRRTVWTVATQPYSGAHFATFPPKLIEPCILAGTSERGVCPECGGPWERVVSGETYQPPAAQDGERDVDASRADKNRKLDGKSEAWRKAAASRKTTGWRPSCSCGHERTVPATVLDPFGGTATTVKVANEHGRRGIALDLSAEYLGLARRRTAETQVRFA